MRSRSAGSSDVTASVVPRVERSAPVRSAMTLRWALCGPNRALASVGSSKDRVSTKAVDDAGVCIDSERRPRAAGGDGLSNPLHGRRAVRQFGNALPRNAAFPSVALPAYKVDCNLSHLRRSVYGSCFVRRVDDAGDGRRELSEESSLLPSPRPSSHPSKTFAFIESLFGVRVARRTVEDGRETGRNGEQGSGVVLNRFGPRRFAAMVIV